jgi:hypothetical protein
MVMVVCFLGGRNRIVKVLYVSDDCGRDSRRNVRLQRLSHTTARPRRLHCAIKASVELTDLTRTLFAIYRVMQKVVTLPIPVCEVVSAWPAAVLNK